MSTCILETINVMLGVDVDAVDYLPSATIPTNPLFYSSVVSSLLLLYMLMLLVFNFVLFRLDLRSG